MKWRFISLKQVPCGSFQSPHLTSMIHIIFKYYLIVGSNSLYVNPFDRQIVPPISTYLDVISLSSGSYPVPNCISKSGASYLFLQQTFDPFSQLFPTEDWDFCFSGVISTSLYCFTTRSRKGPSVIVDRWAASASAPHRFSFVSISCGIYLFFASNRKPSTPTRRTGRYRPVMNRGRRPACAHCRDQRIIGS